MANDVPPDQVLTPFEHLPITFFDSPVLAARHDDGRIYLNIRDLCGAAMIDPSSQMRRIKNHPKLQAGLVKFRVPTAGGPQAQDFLALERVATWLLTVNTAKVSDEVQSRLSFLQDYLVTEVHAAFMRLAGLPRDPRGIEDLADLQRLDYQLVQAWAEAKQRHDPLLSPKAAHATCWGVLKTQFRVARYEDLPASQYPAAVVFIRSAYRQLTGEPLDLPEQGSLDLDGG